jgi:membrane protease YdiL (CAAX protease family)
LEGNPDAVPGRGPGTGLAVLLVEAVGFGFWHFRGFPSGWLGVGLAAVFAFFMGILRQRSKGLLASWVAHIFADTTIYIMVVAMVLVS